ncbi:molybdate ABC transporter substrate-binding protein [Streptomyces sp. NPDC003952]
MPGHVRTPVPVLGGVEIARQVREGARADLIVLADGALADLEAAGHLIEGTVRPLWVSQVVAAPPGVPAGTLLSSGRADLAFQQHSELMDLPGIVVIGPLPGGTAISSTFSAGVLASSAQPGLAREVLDLLGSDAASKTARARGMRRASTTVAFRCPGETER